MLFDTSSAFHYNKIENEAQLWEKMTSRQEQKIRTQQKIVEAANTCFIRKGMAYTLITDICEEAEVSVGTFYHYFNNKNDLIISQFKKFDMGFLEVAHRLIDNPDAVGQFNSVCPFFSRMRQFQIKR